MSSSLFIMSSVLYFILLHANCHSFLNESEARDNDRLATCPGLLRSGMGESLTHNLWVTRQNSFLWATAPCNWYWDFYDSFHFLSSSIALYICIFPCIRFKFCLTFARYKFDRWIDWSMDRLIDWLISVEIITTFVYRPLGAVVSDILA